MRSVQKRKRTIDEKVCRFSIWSTLDKGFVVTIGISILLHITFFGVLLLIPPGMYGKNPILFDSNNRFVEYMLDVPSIERDEMPQWLKRSGKGKRARGEEGQMGKRDGQKAGNYYGLMAPKNNPDPNMARSMTKEMAKNAGIQSYLPGTDSENALGALTGNQVGENFGYGGLGLRGTGRGGGAMGAGAIGLGNLNTIGHGGGGGSGSGYGRGSGSGYGRGSGGLGGTAVPYSYLNDSQKVYWPGHNTETYDHFKDNPFWDSVRNPLSTFSIDVDTASYSNIRRFLNENTLPPKDAIRIEEMINYFAYGYEPPQGPEPFSVHTETAICPWNQDNTLLRIGIKGHEIHKNERPPVNLVFLIDVSGSMTPSNKLPLIKQSLKMLVHELSSKDRISIVVYAGSSGLVLPPTTCSDKRKILDAVYNLEAGGSTNGGQGIRLAYKTAAESFIKHGVNRVILATDGDFNVGVTNQGDLIHLIEEKAKSSVFLTALGFGMGNFKDSTLEKLADRGNGNYSYIDSIKEAKKVLVDQMGGTLFAIAKDVKIQIEFNPTKVGAYRLIGYENRILAAKDFNDDKKDAGEIGSGHVVTALYELVPSGGELGLPSVDPLKYQRLPNMSELASGNELLTLKLRYKDPDGDKSMLIEIPVEDDSQDTGEASHDFKFAAAVAGFGMLLRESPHKGSITFQAVLDLANRGLDWDKNGYRSQFVELVEKARKLRNKTRSEPGKV